jgi:pimeloyl-ACP methyl ester carboxylesterase
MRKDYLVNNNGTQIHYAVLNKTTDSSQNMPWVIIPGMGNSADDVIADLGDAFPDYQVHISLRGRGKSDSPDEGYALNDHISDIEVVANHLGLEQFYLYGHSIGSSMAIRYAHLYPHKVAALAMGDFPPMYPPHDENWAESILANIDEIDMTEKAVRGIVACGEDYIELSDELAALTCPILLIRGGQDDAFFKEEHEPYIRDIVPTIQIAVLNESGHELLLPTPAPFVAALQNFVR